LSPTPRTCRAADTEGPDPVLAQIRSAVVAEVSQLN
jgi:hypothetical protein